jgi:ABC-2 type transport system ATP-binding protein
MLTINKLTKIFRNSIAVNEVSFSINAGEIFSLIGPNGSGKTTIIKIIAGLLQPSAGAVEVDGHNIIKQPQRAKAITGYIPDEPSVWQEMIGVEFLHFTGALYGIEEKKRVARIKELLPIFNLEKIQSGYFEDYSRGNKQKFTILAALLHQPKLLLIDEPIVGLDPSSAETAKQEFVKFAKNGGAVLLATHTLPVAQEISDRIGILKEGKLISVGTMEELRTQAHTSDSASLEEIYMALT